eukprot:TRINITY_DN1143_c0_g1_i1.p1 TRINITY_DN1143_c0_g1~~TRINITY_DN1143_c0_g1_i1.p1  ORF type:complete len:443 (+),score=83.73 TRINITY_DN1143_c0_g1_i1:98-1426(+)
METLLRLFLFLIFVHHIQGDYLLSSGRVSGYTDIQSNNFFEYYGGSVCEIGDIDGDGVVDLVVGAHNSNPGLDRTGCVYLHFMNENGTVRETQRIPHAGMEILLNVYANFGYSVACVPDLNGDGVKDLIVGAPGQYERGAAYVLFLNTSGMVENFTEISGGVGGLDVVFTNGANFGNSITLLGDLNDDGYMEISISSCYSNYTGLIWLLSLNKDGTVVDYKYLSPNDYGISTNSFGYTVSVLPDFNGDGVSDLIVGSANERAWIFYLQPNGTVLNFFQIDNTTAGIDGGIIGDSKFGWAVLALPDFDNDGVQEIAVSAPNYDSGQGMVWIIFMNANGTIKKTQQIAENIGGFNGTVGNSELFGSSLAYWSADGAPKMAVGSIFANWNGKIWILSLDYEIINEANTSSPLTESHTETEPSQTETESSSFRIYFCMALLGIIFS